MSCKDCKWGTDDRPEKEHPISCHWEPVTKICTKGWWCRHYAQKGDPDDD